MATFQTSTRVLIKELTLIYLQQHIYILADEWTDRPRRIQRCDVRSDITTQGYVLNILARMSSMSSSGKMAASSTPTPGGAGPLSEALIAAVAAIPRVCCCDSCRIFL